MSSEAIARIGRRLQRLIDEIEADVSVEEIDRMRAMAAFGEWDHSHRPGHYEIERKAFLAGWAAAKGDTDAA